jgi:hypothetical protein
MTLRFTGLVALAWAAFGLPALAGDIHCVWDRLPADERAKAVTTYKDPDVGSPFSEAEIDAAVRACGSSDQSFGAAGQGLYGLATQFATEQELAQAGVKPEALDAIWRTLDTEMLAKMAVDLQAGPDGPNWNAAVTLSMDLEKLFQKRLGDGADAEPLGDYIVGRALQISFDSEY